MTPLHLRIKDWQTVLDEIRKFFIDRNVTEVITPILIDSAGCELGIKSIPLNNKWLRTSPENEMKCLLLQGSGDIYQIGPVFRQNESGHLHRPEFTMLEWYRCGWSYINLLNECIELFQILLKHQVHNNPLVVLSYQELFEQVFSINPLNVDTETLRNIAEDRGLAVTNAERHVLLDFLFEYATSAFDTAPFYAVEGFPPEQASFANIALGKAERFEIFYKGIELANGYQEITNKDTYLERITTYAQHKGIPKEGCYDQRLLQLLEEHSLPRCAGISVGVDRVLMCHSNVTDIKQVRAID